MSDWSFENKARDYAKFHTCDSEYLEHVNGGNRSVAHSRDQTHQEQFM